MKLKSKKNKKPAVRRKWSLNPVTRVAPDRSKYDRGGERRRARRLIDEETLPNQ
jgi:hypothetical protein